MVSFNNGVLSLYRIILSLKLVGYSPPLCFLFCLFVRLFVVVVFLMIPAKEKNICDGYGNVNHLEMIFESLFCYERHGGAYFTILRPSPLLVASAYVVYRLVSIQSHQITLYLGDNDQITPHLERSGIVWKPGLKPNKTSP